MVGVREGLDMSVGWAVVNGVWDGFGVLYLV